jgi:hypothetical protein
MGFEDSRERTPLRSDLGGVSQQAYDRGASSWLLYQRALAHLESHPEVAETPPSGEQGWLVRLIRTGRA